MSVINSDSVRAGASGAVTAAYTIEQSCRFNDDDSPGLARVPGVAGNRRTWTWSGWVKRGAIGTGGTFVLFSGGTTAADHVALDLDGNDVLNFAEIVSSSYVWNLRTTQVFRDPSAWMHIVAVLDTTDPVAADRQKLYVNGVRVTAFSTTTNAALNIEGIVNQAGVEINTGRRGVPDRYFDGYMADVHFIDGQQLAATSFGETDDQGNWVPIEYEEGSVETTASTVGFTASAVSTSNLTTYTFSSQAIGTATSDRKIVIAVTADGGSARVSTLTVGGVSATVADNTIAAGADDMEVWQAAVPSGTTADVVVVWSTGVSRCGVGLFAVAGAPLRLYDVSTDVTNSGALTTTISCPAGGVIIGAAQNGANASYTWAGITERYDETIEGTISHTGASLAFASAQNNLTVTCTPSASSTEQGLTVLAWGPVDETYGTNGFRLDFANSSDFGNDVRETVTYTACTVTNTASPVTTSNATSHTFSGESIGTASTGRKIVVVASGSGGSTGVVSGITIDGNAMTQVVAAALDGEAHASMFEYNNFNSGTTAEFIVSWSASKGNCGLGVFAVTGATGENTILTGTSNADNPSATIGILNKGVAIGGVVSPASSGLTTHSWTNLTEAYDEQVETTQSHSGASIAHGDSASAPVTITATQSQATDNEAFVVASWGPDGDHSLAQSGLTTADSTKDSPSDSAADDIGNYCVLNPVANTNGSDTFADGNLKITGHNSDNFVLGTVRPEGKVYMEWDITTMSASGASTRQDIGIIRTDQGGWSGTYPSLEANGDFTGTRVPANLTYTDGSSGTDYTDAANGDLIGIALDTDAGKMWIRIDDGTWFAGGDPAAGTTPTVTFTVGGEWCWVAACYGTSDVSTANFGQLAYQYTAPSGFGFTHTARLPSPEIKDPRKYFQANIFTGTGGELVRTLTDSSGSAFKPELIWIKDRDTSTDHVMSDIVRGATKEINPNVDGAASTVAQGIKSFNASGYTLGTDADYNASSSLNVEYCWVLGGTAATNDTGSIDTSLSANTTSKAFALTWTGDETAGATLGHGMGAAPEWLHGKNLVDSGHQFSTGHTDMTSWEYHLRLDDTNAQATNDQWDNASGTGTAPSSTLVTVGASSVENSTSGMMMFGFAGVENFSKFGSYEGNADASDGTFIWLGFRPALFIAKNLDATGGWYMYDSARNPNNPAVGMFYMDAAVLTADQTDADLEFLSNGVKMRVATHPNKANTYVFAAWAEFPVGGSGVAQARAR
jgi:hypothetical protein